MSNTGNTADERTFVHRVARGRERKKNGGNP